jgi:hypothetical protein
MVFRIKPLEELTLGQRIALAFAIAVIVSLVLACVSFFLGGKAESATTEHEVCMDPTERERIRDIVLTGIDKGLEEQIRHLFEIWMKDSSDQPKRAMVGTSNAYSAHARARRQAVAWEPPVC